MIESNQEILVGAIPFLIALVPITAGVSLLHKWYSGITDPRVAVGVLCAVLWGVCEIILGLAPFGSPYGKTLMVLSYMSPFLYFGVTSDWLLFAYQTRFKFWRLDALVVLNVLCLAIVILMAYFEVKRDP